MDSVEYQSQRGKDRRPSDGGISQYGVLDVKWFGMFRKTVIGNFDELWKKVGRYGFGYTYALERL